MKHIKTSAILLVLTAVPAVFVVESMDGMDTKPVGHTKQPLKLVAAEIRKIHLDTGKVTLKHGAIDNLGMGAMTMASTVKDKASLKNFKEDQSVLVASDMVDDQLTVVDLRSK